MGNFVQEITLTLRDNVSKQSKAVVKSLQGMALATNKLNNQFNQVTLAASQVMSKLKYVALAAVGAGVGIFALALKTSESAENLLNLSERTGVSVIELQKLGYVAETSGLSVDTMNESFKFLNRSMIEAARDGAGPTAESFAAMGVSVTKSNGQLKDTTDLFYELSDAFKKNQNAPLKTSAAMSIFGRAGSLLIPILNKGTDAIKKQEERFARYANLMDKPALEAIENFNNVVKDAKIALGALGSIIAQSLIPTLEPLVKKFADFVASNKDLIRTKVTDFIQAVKDNAAALWPKIKEGARIFMDFIDSIGGFKNILLGIAAVFAGDLLTSVLKFGAEVTKLGAMFLASGPFGLVLAGFVALGVYLYDSKTGFDGLADKVVGTAEIMLEKFRPVLDMLKAVIDTVEKALVKMGILEKKEAERKQKKFAHVSVQGDAQTTTTIDPVTGLPKATTKTKQQIIDEMQGGKPESFDVNKGSKMLGDLKKNKLDINLNLNTENKVSYVDIDTPILSQANITVDAGQMVGF